EHVLAVGPRPGIVLAPRRKHAFVVLRSANDATGAPLGVAPELARALAGGGDLFALIAPAVRAGGVDPDQVAGAAGFTTDGGGPVDASRRGAPGRGAGARRRSEGAGRQ